MVRRVAASRSPNQSDWSQEWVSLLLGLLIGIASTVGGGQALAQMPGAPINVTPAAAVPTVLRTIVIEENNATETGDANIPLSVTIGTTTYTYGIQLGTVDVTEDSGAFS